MKYSKIILLGLTILFIGCGTSQYIKHPGYSSISQSATIGIYPLQYNLIIHDQKEFSEKLNIQREYLHQSLSTKLTNQINTYLNTLLQKPVLTLPEIKKSDRLPIESHNLINSTYLKTSWPAQGTILLTQDSLVPDYILFFHEINIGLGLLGESLYDYKNSNKEVGEASDKLSIVITYSLWDNKKQQYVIIGYEESILENDSSSFTYANITELLDSTTLKIIKRTPIKLRRQK